MAWLLQCIAGILQGFLPIYPVGLGVAQQDCGAGCPCWWLHSPIHPKYVLWGCSLAILQAAPSYWHCFAEGNQGLPEHGEVWRYHLWSSSYPRNVVWQKALSFAKCPVELTGEVSVGEHKRRFGTTVKSSLDVYQATTSVDLISLAPLHVHNVP